MTTDINRIQNIAKHAEGFIYTVTMNATTGEDGTFHPKLKDQIKMIKSFTSLPVVAGFGIRTTDHIKDLVKDEMVLLLEVKSFEDFKMMT